MLELYYVGGCVRDKLMGVTPNDIDYVVVDTENRDIEQSYSAMIDYLQEQGYKIFLQMKQCYTVRCAKNGVADFVLARKEVGYEKKTRMPICLPGTLYEDLERRDFTVNAIAEDADGNLYDYFNGIQDIKNKVLRTPIDPYKSFSDDPLRLLRAIRFKITKRFVFCKELDEAFNDDGLWNKLKPSVSNDRIREELYKCFKYNTVQTLEVLRTLSPTKLKILFGDKLWLKPTVEKQ